jgi:hypothetical protein
VLVTSGEAGREAQVAPEQVQVKVIGVVVADPVYVIQSSA